MQVCRSRGGIAPPPQFLVDQLTLSQPGGAHYPHLVLRALPDFQALRQPWVGRQFVSHEEFSVDIRREVTKVTFRDG